MLFEKPLNQPDLHLTLATRVQGKKQGTAARRPEPSFKNALRGFWPSVPDTVGQQQKT